MSKTNVITSRVRFSYLNAFEAKPTPSGDLKFSACLLIPKSDTKGVEEIKRAIQAAVDKGIESNKFTAANVKASTFKLALRDGDEEFKNGDRGPEYQGHYFLNASSKNRPGIVDRNARPLMDPDEFYSGCYGHADINFYPFNTSGNRGIGVGLNNLMKWEDGERLDGRQSAEQAFSHLQDRGGSDTSDSELE